MSREKSERIRRGASRCGCDQVAEPPRRINLTITRCTMCPFMVRYDNEHAVQVMHEDGETSHEGTVQKGWYCLHPVNRDKDEPIATYKQVTDSDEHVVGLDSWLKHHVGGLFPEFCPLKKPTVRNEPTGARALDLGTSIGPR